MKNTGGSENGFTTDVIKRAIEVTYDRFFHDDSSLNKGIMPNAWKILLVTPVSVYEKKILDLVVKK